MNKKWLPHGITAGAFVVFIVLGLACGSSPPAAPPAKWKDIVYTGENAPLLEGTTWTYINTGNEYIDTREFRAGGKLIIHGDSGNHTWKREGNTVYMITDDGWSHFIGTYYPETKKILGSAERSSGVKFDWTMEPRDSVMPTPSAAPAASAGASQSNTRTVAVTVYYELNGARLPAIYTVTASTANEAEEQGRRLWQNQFGFNAQAKFISATAAWY
jgi:hypothetical protein